jgi:acyl carrier protein
MTREELDAAVFEALGSVAPEADRATLRRDLPLRDQIDLDSMDYLRFIVALHDRLGVDVPESDYPRLATLDGAVDYLAVAKGGG